MAEEMTQDGRDQAETGHRAPQGLTLGSWHVDQQAQQEFLSYHGAVRDICLVDEAAGAGTDERFLVVRLAQVAYHNRSMSLYSKLRFTAGEPLSCLQGTALNIEIPGYAVRAATTHNLDACNRLCLSVHGHDRRQEVADAIAQGTARIVEHDGAVTGYATDIGFFAHAVGQTKKELKALIGAAAASGGPGFSLPMRNAELFRWCPAQGLRTVQPMTLMTMGLYQIPAGAFLPSVLC